MTNLNELKALAQDLRNERTEALRAADNAQAALNEIQRKMMVMRATRWSGTQGVATPLFSCQFLVNQIWCVFFNPPMSDSKMPDVCDFSQYLWTAICLGFKVYGNNDITLRDFDKLLSFNGIL